MINFIGYGASLLTLLVLDGLWLGLVARSMYKAQMADLLSDAPRIAPIVIFYVMYAACITYLVTKPWTGSIDWKSAALTGAVLGLAAYGAYDMTNYAVIKNFPLKVTLIDWAWGVVITACASTSGALAVKYFSTK